VIVSRAAPHWKVIVPSSRLRPRLAALTVLAVALAAPRVVWADAGSAPAERQEPSACDVELAAAVGYTTAPIRGGTTPFGTGFGGRLGLVFTHVYVGLHGMGYLGGTDVDISDRAFLGGLEVGYGGSVQLGSGRLTFRPTVGVGTMRILHTDPSLAQSRGVDVVTTASGRSSGGGGASDTTAVDSFYVQPTFNILYGSGVSFVAVNANVLVAPGISYDDTTTTWLAYGIQGQLGLRF
jgi:hypothetical protein